MTGAGDLLASGQTGPLSVVRIWRMLSGECLAICKTHAHSLSGLRYGFSLLFQSTISKHSLNTV